MTCTNEKVSQVGEALQKQPKADCGRQNPGRSNPHCRSVAQLAVERVAEHSRDLSGEDERTEAECEQNEPSEEFHGLPFRWTAQNGSDIPRNGGSSSVCSTSVRPETLPPSYSKVPMMNDQSVNRRGQAGGYLLQPVPEGITVEYENGDDG